MQKDINKVINNNKNKKLKKIKLQKINFNSYLLKKLIKLKMKIDKKGTITHNLKFVEIVVSKRKRKNLLYFFY